jgi:hypothetical protein
VQSESGVAAARHIRPGFRSLRSHAAAGAIDGPSGGPDGPAPGPVTPSASGGSRRKVPGRARCARRVPLRRVAMRAAAGAALFLSRTRRSHRTTTGRTVNSFFSPFFCFLPFFVSFMPSKICRTAMIPVHVWADSGGRFSVAVPSTFGSSLRINGRSRAKPRSGCRAPRRLPGSARAESSGCKRLRHSAPRALDAGGGGSEGVAAVPGRTTRARFDARPSGGGYYKATRSLIAYRAGHADPRPVPPALNLRNLRNLCSNFFPNDGGRCNACRTKMNGGLADSMRSVGPFPAPLGSETAS